MLGTIYHRITKNTNDSQMHLLHGSLWHTSVVQIVVPSLDMECPSPGEDSTPVLHIQDVGELELYNYSLKICESLVFFVIL